MDISNFKLPIYSLISLVCTFNYSIYTIISHSCFLLYAAWKFTANLGSSAPTIAASPLKLKSGHLSNLRARGQGQEVRKLFISASADFFLIV